MGQVGAAYLPTDRYFSLLKGQPLPDQARGAVLFADISGFTPLTEAYSRLLGPRLGAEELARQLNMIYDALIDQVSLYGGSVVGFGGDAITCWYAEMPSTADCEPATVRALASAVAMQEAMASFSALQLQDGTEVRLGVKIAVSYGEVRRFLVGDPEIHLIDILSGDPVTRVAALEHSLSRGEIGVDKVVVNEHPRLIDIAEWRLSGELGDKFAVIRGLKRAVDPVPWPDKRSELPEDTVRPWLFPEIYENLQINERELAAELRPVAALFLQFKGIDYQGADAGQKLDRFIRWVQHLLRRYDAPLLQVTLGDKGSYLYAVFGAPTAHADYSRRAVAAAAELLDSATARGDVDEVHIGISQGTVWVGAYGAAIRRTYGVHGDEVNVAARLMQHAGPNEIWGTGHIVKVTSSEFAWKALPPLAVKGKAQPLTVARLIERYSDQQTTTSVYTGPLVGREKQLQSLVSYIETVQRRHAAGIMYVSGEPGMGKSRVMYELQQQVGDRSRVLWMTFPTDELFRESLHPFRHYLRHYFGQSAQNSPEENRNRFHMGMDRLLTDLRSRQQDDLRQKLIQAEPFLAALVDLYWDDSAYFQVEPRQRFERTMDSLLWLIDAESLRQCVVLQFEDGQWLDSDSIEFIRILSRRTSDVPPGLIITCRPQDDGLPWMLPVDEHIPQQTVWLRELGQEDVAALAEQVLAGPVSPALARFLASKTGGNPFLVEQFVLDLQERALLQLSPVTGWSVSEDALVEVPTNVRAILIARLDRLSPRVKTLVQTGAVLGNDFEARVLARMLPASFDVYALVNEAESASIWAQSSGGRYAFRHTLLRDAAYQMQLSTALRSMHQLASMTIEAIYGEDAGSQAVELAYHCESSRDFMRAAHWYTTAGDNALKIYALENVISYYRNALSCWETSAQSADAYRALRLHVLLELGNALRWRNYSQQALDIFGMANEEAIALDDDVSQCEACIGLAATQYDEGDFRTALASATLAERLAAQQGVSRRLRTVLEMKCWCLFRLGELGAARSAGEAAVAVSSELGEPGHLAQSLSVLGLVLMASGEVQAASQSFERALALAEDPMDVVGVTNNLGVIAMAQGNYERAALRYEEALRLARQHNIAEAELVFRSNLGGAHVGLGLCEEAEAELRDVITLVGDTGFGDLSETFRFLAEALLGQGRLDEAYDAARRALTLGYEVGAPEFIAIAWRVLGEILSYRGVSLRFPQSGTGEGRDYSAADCFAESLKICQETGMKGEIPRVLRAWALFEIRQGHVENGLRMIKDALAAFSSVGAVLEVERTARLAGISAD